MAAACLASAGCSITSSATRDPRASLSSRWGAHASSAPRPATPCFRLLPGAGAPPHPYPRQLDREDSMRKIFGAMAVAAALLMASAVQAQDEGTQDQGTQVDPG